MKDTHPDLLCLGKTGAGVDDLINVMVRHLPNPSEANAPLFTMKTETTSN